MDFLGNILSGQDLVNKDYVDKAIPVVPTKVSAFTNDAGYITAEATVDKAYQWKNTEALNKANADEIGNVTGWMNKSVGSTNMATAAGTIMQFGSAFSKVQIFGGYAKNTSNSGDKGYHIRKYYADYGWDAWEEIITSGNFSSYALPLSGGTIAGNGAGLLTINRKDGNPVIEFRHNGSIMGRYGFATDGTPIGVVAGSQVTLIHSGNIGSQSVNHATSANTLSNFTSTSGEAPVDCNNVTTNGLRYYTANGPEYKTDGSFADYFDGSLYTQAYSDIWVTQIAQGYRNGGLFTRSRNNGTWTEWRKVAYIGDNVASATKLQTARTIWGQSFDGTGNVSGNLYLGSNIIYGGSNYNIIDISGGSGLNIGYGIRSVGSTVYWAKSHAFYVGDSHALTINSSGNVTIGSSDTAGTDYKLRVDGKSRFTDRVSVTSLRIVPVNGSFAADFAMDGSSLTLNRELKFTNVTASDICSGIAAAFKTSLAQAENLIARNIILGASSGSASNLAFSFQKYTSISNTAPNGLTTLMTLTTDGNLGIGTVTPEYKLDVAGTMIANTYRKRTASSNRVLCTHDGESLIFGDTTGLTFLRGSEIVFQPVVGQRVATITSTGLGIGTASPEYKLDVVGKARISDELIVTYPTGFRWAYGDYGVLFRNDANKFYVLLTDAGGALSGSWNALRPFAISLTTGDVTMGHNLDVKGTIKSSSLICGTSRLRVNSPTNGGVFGYMDAQLFQDTNNVSSVHIGSCFGGNSTIDDTTEHPSGVSMTAISIYRGRVGIGKRWSDTELRALHDANCSLGVWNNAHIMGNLAVSSIYSDNGQSGAAGVVLRNEGGIEITHASTPYIDFHHSAGTSDFGHRLIARDSGIFAYSGNYFCPWGKESLGSSTYRWNILWVSGINVSGNTDVGGALTVGAGATFNGDVRINGNLVVTGDTASGGAGQETTSTSQLLVINQIIPEGTSVTQSALDAIGLTSDVIDDLIEGKYHHVLEVIGSNKSLYTISGYKSTTTREFILQYGSAEVDTAWWYAFRQYNGGNWSVVFDEI